MRVRRGFVIALCITMAVLAHSIWDYVESRRVRQRLDAIRAADAPTTMSSAKRLSGSAADADRYYRAAAALAGRAWESIPPGHEYRMSQALRDDNWPPGLVADLRSILEGHREALMYVDRAAALPFEGFDAGWTANYGAGAFMVLSRLCEMRAVDRALSGDSDGAFESMYADVRLERVMLRPPLFKALGFVASRTTPSEAARSRVDRALADIDHDDRLQLAFIRLRAQLFDMRWQDLGSLPWVVRPWVSHAFVNRLDTFADLIAAAARPPAERVAAVMAVGTWPTPPPFALSPERSRSMLESFTRGVVAEAERVRCARRVVAGEMVNCLP
jgi:hypothetical protein